MEFKVKIDLEKTIEAKNKKQAFKKFLKATEGCSMEEITQISENKTVGYIR